MNCPRCTDTELLERDRDGITVDGCPRCRGLWLDRGELERLLARAAEEEFPRAGSTRHPGSRDTARQDPDLRHGKRPDYDDDDDDDHRRHRTGGRPRRWYDTLGDFFD